MSQKGYIDSVQEIKIVRAPNKGANIVEPLYYTAETKMKSVSKEEFDAFIKNYPRPLCVDVTGISDPPAISYNDFALADRWPYSIVASTFAYDNDPVGYYYVPPEKRRYRIMENCEEVFASKTGYATSAKSRQVYYAPAADEPPSEEDVVFSVKNVKSACFNEVKENDK